MTFLLSSVRASFLERRWGSGRNEGYADVLKRFRACKIVSPHFADCAFSTGGRGNEMRPPVWQRQPRPATATRGQLVS